MQPISVPWPNESSVGAKLTKGSKASIDLREEVRSQVAYDPKPFQRVPDAANICAEYLISSSRS